jgi:N-acetylglucosaminyldiphosphoundecaprenol N-acetyl-beta-D-mannosaminyltransferase
MSTAITRVNIIGAAVSAINMSQALAFFREAVAERRRTYVCVADAHAILWGHWDKDFRRVHNSAGMVTPDGMPLVWLCRRAGQRHVERVYGPDLMQALCAASAREGYRHVLVGGAEGVAGRLATSLSARYPALQVVDTFTPPFRPLTDAEEDELVARVNQAAPDIVWIGLSTPKQERLMARLRPRLEAPVLVGVGAAFNFLSGSVKQAPRAIQRSGLEWLFRLATEPRRLWRRYLSVIPLFLALTTMQQLGLRRFSVD